MLSIKYYILLRFSCASQTPKGVFYGNSKKNLWEFMAHWWTFMTKRKIHVMNIFVSFMNIYDYSQREAQNHLWTFMASLMIIYDQKKARSAKKRRPFMIFFDQKTAKRKTEEHLCFIDDHFWQKTRYKRVGGVRVFV